MTLEAYYIKKSALEAPKGLGFLEERKWFIEAIQKLQSKLSESDLKIVTAEHRTWREKVNSSVV